MRLTTKNQEYTENLLKLALYRVNTNYVLSDCTNSANTHNQYCKTLFMSTRRIKSIRRKDNEHFVAKVDFFQIGYGIFNSVRGGGGDENCLNWSVGYHLLCIFLILNRMMSSPSRYNHWLRCYGRFYEYEVEKLYFSASKISFYSHN